MIPLIAAWLKREFVWRIGKGIVFALMGAALMISSCLAIGGTTPILIRGVQTGQLHGAGGQPGGQAPGPTAPGLPPVQPVPTLAAVPVPTVSPGAVVPIEDLLAAQFIANLKTWLNPPVRYLWSGCSRAGVDCSCLVMLNLATVGITSPRTTGPQMQWVIPMARANLQPGALLFFNNTCSTCGANPTHVGVYIGNGLMIDAGDPVQVESINTPYWVNHWAGAGWPPGL